MSAYNSQKSKSRSTRPPLDPVTLLGQSITAVKLLAADLSSCTVKVGKHKLGSLNYDHALELGVTVGAVYEGAFAQKLNHAIAADAARRDALRIINRRLLSSDDLADRLRKRKHDPDHINPVIQNLKDVGLLDDEACARSIIASVKARQQIGARLLQQKLFQKRIPRPIIEKLLAEYREDDQTDELAEATDLLRKKLATTSMQQADPLTRKRRLSGLLARRGFDFNTIQQAFNAVSVDDQPNDDVDF